MPVLNALEDEADKKKIHRQVCVPEEKGSVAYV